MNYLKSPINYTGSKYRILKYILPLFPNDINTFIDLFGGAGNVSINVKANKIYYNEIINFIPELYNCWKYKTNKQINECIDETISQWNLSSTNKTAFEDFRNYYNLTKNIQDLFILICFSFNYQIRFNNKHEYNSSFGKEASTMNNNIRNNLNLFLDYIHNNDIKFLCNDFRKLKLDKLSQNDFIYMDMPYLNTTATYNENDGWDIQDDYDVFELCEKLNLKNIKWGISNVFENKGNINQHLIDWCDKNNWNVYTFDTHTYMACGKGNSNAKEVYICNYEVNNEVRDN